MTRKTLRFAWPALFNFVVTVAAIIVLANVIYEEKSMLHIVGASVGLTAAISFLVTSIVTLVLHLSGFDIFS